MDKTGTILVVGGDEFIRLAIVKYCSGYAPTVSVATIEAAMQALEEDVVAMILDIHPQDDLGLDLPEKVRQRKPLLPVLIRTDRVTPTIARLAAQHRAELLGQSDSTKRLRDFITRAIRAHRASQPRLPLTRPDTVG